jgi:hypothetical protein
MNQQAHIEAVAPARPMRTSELLRKFAHSLPSDRVTLAEIVSGLGDRGLGVLIAIFALPNILPSTVPFGNVATGIPVLIFSVQLLLGVEQALAPRVASVLSWFERLLTPRLSWVTGQRAERFIGVVAIILALVSTLPIPFGHNLPALGLVLIGLGLIERDGLAILTGAAIGLLGSILLGLVIFGVAHGLSFIIHAHNVHL